jgi:hypothetical protein
MTTSPTPHAFPTQMRDTFTTEIYDTNLDANTQFIVRRLIADAYALGYQQGGMDQQQFDRVARESV